MDREDNSWGWNQLEKSFLIKKEDDESNYN